MDALLKEDSSVTKKLVLAALCLMVLAPLAHATCNSPGAQWSLAAQWLYDWRWEEVGSCNAWQPVNGADRPYDADNCPSSLVLIDNYQGRMKGEDGAGVIRAWYQDVTIDGWGNSLAVGFIPNVIGDLGTWDTLRVTLRDPSDNSWLANVITLTGNTSYDCSQVSVSVPGDWSDQSLRLYFEATIYSGDSSDAFIIDAVTLHTSQY
jgi:hypothetical protein